MGHTHSQESTKRLKEGAGGRLQRGQKERGCLLWSTRSRMARCSWRGGPFLPFPPSPGCRKPRTWKRRARSPPLRSSLCSQISHKMGNCKLESGGTYLSYTCTIHFWPSYILNILLVMCMHGVPLILIQLYCLYRVCLIRVHDVLLFLLETSLLSCH